MLEGGCYSKPGCLSLEVVQGPGDGPRKYVVRFGCQIRIKVLVPVDRDRALLRRDKVVRVASVLQIFQLVHVLPAPLLLVNAAHVFRLPVRQLIVRDRFLVLVPDGRLVVDVDIALDVATGRLCGVKKRETFVGFIHR